MVPPSPFEFQGDHVKLERGRLDMVTEANLEGIARTYPRNWSSLCGGRGVKTGLEWARWSTTPTVFSTSEQKTSTGQRGGRRRTKDTRIVCARK